MLLEARQEAQAKAEAEAEAKQKAKAKAKAKKKWGRGKGGGKDGAADHGAVHSRAVHPYIVSGPWEDVACQACGRNAGQKKLITTPGVRGFLTFQMRCFDFTTGCFFEVGMKHCRKKVSRMPYDPAVYILDWVTIHRNCC